MLTRRQWLQTNPRPKSPINLQALLEQEQRAAAAEQDQITQIYNQLTVANQAGKTADAAKLNADLVAARSRQRQVSTSATITQLTAEIARAVKCPIHQLGLHYHRNRPEDLYVCENGPHFLFWTLQSGKAQLVVVPTLMLPGLDYPMTEGTKISRMEWLSQHPPQTAECPQHKAKLVPFTERPIDVFVCMDQHEKYIWMPLKDGPGLAMLAGDPPGLELPID